MNNITVLLTVLLVIFVLYFLTLTFLNQNLDNNEEVISEVSGPAPATAQLSIDRDPEELNALDRFYNPLRFPYKTYPTYYNPFTLPNNVIGCGSRNAPCVGVGSSISPIANPLPGFEVGPGNIAPVSIHTRGPIGQPQQVGTIYKVNGDQNTIYPLMGRKKYPNGDKWEYYTLMGLNGNMKVRVPPKRNDQELGNNDIIRLDGAPGLYRVSVYESDFPQYIPYA